MIKADVRIPRELARALDIIAELSGISKSELMRLALKRFAIEVAERREDPELCRLARLVELRELKRQLDELFAFQKAMLAHGSYVKQAADRYAVADSISAEERSVLRKILAHRERLAKRIAKLLDELLPGESLEPIVVDRPPYLRHARREGRGRG